MNDEAREQDQAKIANPLLPRFATRPLMALAEDGARPAEPLLLPPANPAYSREPSYDEQDIDGYTLAEAHAALDAFKRRRSHRS